MECTIHWQPASGMAFMAETGSGHIINMDGAPDGGGRNLAPRPMETVLAGTGGCTAYDVVLILQRGRHDIRGCQVKLTADRAETDPKVFTKINMHFIVTGVNLPETAVQRAIQMSHEKYCSASIMLGRAGVEPSLRGADLPGPAHEEPIDLPGEPVQRMSFRHSGPRA